VFLPVQAASSIKLLVVDDDEIDRAQVERALRKAAPHVAFHLEEARDPQEARSAAKNGAFDCILLDYLLSGVRATELLPVLGALQPEAAIVVLTGQGDEAIAVELMKAGVADYLSKDRLDPGRLWTAIRYAVALSKVRRDTAHFENARRRRTAQLRALVEAAPAISGALSADELARVAAERARDVLGVPEAFVLLREGEAESASVAALGRDACPDDVALWKRALRSLSLGRGAQRVVLEGRTTAAIVLPLIARDGTPVGVIAASEPLDPAEIESSEQILAQVAQLVAVTMENARLLRETQEAVRARDEVLAVVSHDLRTPLNNVRLALRLLQDQSGGVSPTLFDRIERNVHHMSRLVEDLVDLARIECNRLRISAHGERVHDILQAALALMQPQADDARVELLTHAVSANLRVRADRHRTLQVLCNLIGNAIKFTPPSGKVQISVEERGREVCFHVADSGPGIGPEDAPHIFARFFQARSSRPGGLGLGLYIAKAVVDAHGGRIWFHSEPGRGTTFSFTLPVEAAELDVGTLLESAGSP
jgi:signal transduction histidine kinase